LLRKFKDFQCATGSEKNTFHLGMGISR